MVERSEVEVKVGKRGDGDDDERDEGEVEGAAGGRRGTEWMERGCMVSRLYC